jgi:hypothetical protein
VNKYDNMTPEQVGADVAAALERDEYVPSAPLAEAMGKMPTADFLVVLKGMVRNTGVSSDNLDAEGKAYRVRAQNLNRLLNRQPGYMSALEKFHATRPPRPEAEEPEQTVVDRSKYDAVPVRTARGFLLRETTVGQRTNVRYLLDAVSHERNDMTLWWNENENAAETRAKFPRDPDTLLGAYLEVDYKAYGDLCEALPDCCVIGDAVQAVRVLEP